MTIQTFKFVEYPDEESLHYTRLDEDIKEAPNNKWVFVGTPSAGSTVWVYKDPEHFTRATISPNISRYGVVAEWKCAVSRILKDNLRVMGYDATGDSLEELKEYCEEAIAEIRKVSLGEDNA